MMEQYSLNYHLNYPPWAAVHSRVCLEYFLLIIVLWRISHKEMVSMMKRDICKQHQQGKNYSDSYVRTFYLRMIVL